jgi:hypothetical protein
LIDDLEERGLLDETLVVVNAECGLTPKINNASGRDHWPGAYSLAAAGVRAGTIYRACDSSAAYPTANPSREFWDDSIFPPPKHRKESV